MCIHNVHVHNTILLSFIGYGILLCIVIFPYTVFTPLDAAAFIVCRRQAGQNIYWRALFNEGRRLFARICCLAVPSTVTRVELGVQYAYFTPLLCGNIRVHTRIYVTIMAHFTHLLHAQSALKARCKE